MKNALEAGRSIEVLRDRAIFVSYPNPITARELDLAAGKLGGYTYGMFTPHPDQQVAYLSQVAGGLNDKVILDAGCGAGTTVLYAALGDTDRYGKPKMVIGIDRWGEQVEIAQKLAAKFRKRQAYEGTPVYLEEGRFENLRLIPSASVDVVHESTYLYEPHSHAAYRELLRVVADGGILSLTAYGGETGTIIENIAKSYKRQRVELTWMPDKQHRVYRVNKTPRQAPSSL